MSKKPNRLINEKSPYLLAHAYNPVDWYPWSVEAFEKAKKKTSLFFYQLVILPVIGVMLWKKSLLKMKR